MQKEGGEVDLVEVGQGQEYLGHPGKPPFYHFMYFTDTCCRYLFSVMFTKCAINRSGADPGFDQGGAPDRDRPKLPTVCSSVMRAKRALFSMGSGTRPRSSWVFHY